MSNAGSEEKAAEFLESVSDDWESIGNYTGNIKICKEFVGQLSGFSKLIPDMNWQIEEMIEGEDREIVRGRATGTPVGPFFGVDGEGSSFEIMSIEIHTLEDGKIDRTYHVEDWAGAIGQLRCAN